MIIRSDQERQRHAQLAETVLPRNQDKTESSSQQLPHRRRNERTHPRSRKNANTTQPQTKKTTQKQNKKHQQNTGEKNQRTTHAKRKQKKHNKEATPRVTRSLDSILSATPVVRNGSFAYVAVRLLHCSLCVCFALIIGVFTQ